MTGAEIIGKPRADSAAILLFWPAQFAILTGERLLFEADSGHGFLAPRACVALAGVAISLALAQLYRRLEGARLAHRVAVAVSGTIAGAMLHALANFGIFGLFMFDAAMRNATLAAYAQASIEWFWTYATLSALLLVIAYSAELRERDQRMAQLRVVAHAAQMQALRYQLHPHFMFNTLNAIASLIARRDVADAEAMVEDLADFLRATLALKPEEDIPLARELELQTLYLNIERARFPDRLTVAVDVPEYLRDALVPSLITQPLVENVVKHAVRRSTATVTIGITAERHGQELILIVQDSGSDAAPDQRARSGVGLVNVAERLALRHGERARFSAGPIPGGGFAVRLSLPILHGGPP